MTPTGHDVLTGPHLNPVTTVLDGSSLYLLANQMGIDTNVGGVYPYALDSTQTLVAEAPAPLIVASGAVGAVVEGANLYAVSANAIGSASGAAPGGNIDRYVIATDGSLTPAGTTTVAAGLPTSLAAVAAH